MPTREPRMNWYLFIDFFFLIRNLPLVENIIKHKGKMMRHPQRTKENENENENKTKQKDTH